MPSAEKKVKVLVADDSAFYRLTIAEMLKDCPDIEVLGTVADGSDAIKVLSRMRPDVITLDLEMNPINGFQFLKWLRDTNPIPVLVVSSHGGSENVFRALELGAADFLVKPTSKASPLILSIQEELISKVLTLAQISPKKLVHKADLPAQQSERYRTEPLPHRERKTAIRLVAIGASTGGPSAVQSLVTAFPSDFPSPVVIAQHMPEGFTAHFAERLDKMAHVPVREAKHGDPVERGTVYIAPGGHHLRLVKKDSHVHVVLEGVRQEDRYVPSVDRMMTSASEVYASSLLGVLLTGMGNDGKVGMTRIKEKGGETIAESEETAVVYGMPKEAVAAGVVDHLLPLPVLVQEVLKRCYPYGEK